MAARGVTAKRGQAVSAPTVSKRTRELDAALRKFHEAQRKSVRVCPP